VTPSHVSFILSSGQVCGGGTTTARHSSDAVSATSPNRFFLALDVVFFIFVLFREYFALWILVLF